MANASVNLQFSRHFEPETGKCVPIAPGVARVTAPNAHPFTFTGTNAYLIGEKRVAVVDPGPDDQNQFDALVRAIDGREVEAVILTHSHRDHAGLVAQLAQHVNAPVWMEGAHRFARELEEAEVNPLPRAGQWDLEPDRLLVSGEVIEIDGIGLELIATPGHCANHISFGIVDRDIFFSGDHVMAWSTSLVAAPEGLLSDYLASLDRVIEARWDYFLPGHGGPVENGRAFSRGLKAHRLQRCDQIVSFLGDGAKSADQLTSLIYPKLDESLLGGARMTVAAHLEYLVDIGTIGQDGPIVTATYFRKD